MTQSRVGLLIILLLGPMLFPRDGSEITTVETVRDPIAPETMSNMGERAKPAKHENAGISQYRMHAVVDTLRTHSLTCTYSIEYLNTEPGPLSELYFHVYPNAWQPDQPFELGGALLVQSVTDHTGTPFMTKLVGTTNLRVTLHTTLLPGHSVKVHMEFNVQIPHIPNRFGYWQSDNMTSHNLGNWYPIVAVREESGWHTAPYAYWGESFYSEIADYQVNITVPTGERVAATGRLVTQIPGSDGTTTWVWEAEAVRDFVFSVSPDFQVSTKTIPGTTIYSYYGVNDSIRGEQALNIAESCLTLFSKLYGPYPYPTLSIVENPDGIGGMEYPTLVLMGSGLYHASDRTFEAIIVHEIAHQWFPFLIGDNAFAEPFLDEAFATFSEQLYWEFVYGLETAEIAWRNTLNHYYSYLSKTGIDEPLNQTMAFWDRNEPYFPIVYSKGALVLRMLRFVVGNDMFFHAMHVYYDQFLHKNAKIADFVSIVEDISESDLTWFFMQWVYSSGLPEYDLERVELNQIGNEYELIISVQQQTQYAGSQLFQMPVPFEIQYEQHTETRIAWINASRQEVHFIIDEKPISVELDPQQIILRANMDQSLIIQIKGSIFRRFLVITSVLILGFASLVLLRKWRKSRP